MLLLPKNLGCLAKRCSSWWNHPGHKDFKSKLLDHDFSIYIDNDTYSDEPIYPPIQPKYPPSSPSWGQMDPKIAWKYENFGIQLDRLRTVPERLAVLAHENSQALPDRYGKLKVCRNHIWQLQGLCRGARSLPLLKYLTNTHLVEWNDHMPGWHNRHPVSDELVDTVHKTFYETIADNPPLTNEYSPPDPEKYRAPSIQEEEELNDREEANLAYASNLARCLAESLPSCHFNVDVPMLAFWKRGGFDGLASRVRGYVAEDGSDVRSFQFEDKAAAQLKRSLPLPEVVPVDYGRAKYGSVPYYLYHPGFYDIFTDQTIPMQVPGQWYGSKHAFNLLTIYSTAKTRTLRHDGPIRETILGWAILAGHAELTAQAYHAGFSMWRRDLTYPMVAQIALMDGDDWTFAVYQLNSLQLFKDQHAEVPVNLCWVSPPMKWDRQCAELLARMGSMPLDETERDWSPYAIPPSALETQRHRQLARQLYDCVRHSRRQSRFDTTKIESVNAGTNFYRWYDDVCSRFRDVVRAEYPLRWWGHTLQQIDRIGSHPSRANYNILRPDEKTTFIHEY